MKGICTAGPDIEAAGANCEKAGDRLVDCAGTAAPNVSVK